MYNPPFLPETFEVPETLETDRMRLRALTIHDAVKDYAAVMESEERLRSVFRPGGSWPDGLTLEANILDCAWHQKEFELRSSFTYTVVNLAETAVLGCLYIYPTRAAGYDADITMWVHQSEAAKGLDAHLFDSVESWVASSWPFSNPAYPGRRISFEDWSALAPDSPSS